MSFGEKLSLLMSLQNTSNSQLARVLAVDTSLVSRWRKGTRTPAKDGPHLKKLADYFASQARKDYQKIALLEIMNLPADKYPKDDSALADLLYAWLSEVPLSESHLVNRFLNRLDLLQNPQNPPQQALQTKTAVPASLPDSRFPAEVFYGIKGKQEAAVRFLTLAAQQQKPGVILLYSDENIEWFTGDKTFLATLVQLFGEVIALGNRIKMVHNVSRDMAEMFAAIDFWMPFYMTGAVESYYCPRYREHYFRRTMFVAPQTAALTSAVLSGCEKFAANIFTTDPQWVASLTEEFEEYLAICRPLIRILKSSSYAETPKLITELEEQPENYLTLSDTLSTLTMPNELWEQILERSGIDRRTREELVSLHNKRRQYLLSNLQSHIYTEIAPLPEAEEIIGGQARIDTTGIPGNPVLHYTAAEYRAHLQHLLQMLKEYPSFSFYPCSRNPLGKIRLAVKEEVGVIVVKKDVPSTLFAFNQQNMTNAFYCYMEDFINGIPHKDRDRQQVIEKIEHLLRCLS